MLALAERNEAPLLSYDSSTDSALSPFAAVFCLYMPFIHAIYSFHLFTLFLALSFIYILESHDLAWEQ
jgi:hypothetical protein